MNEFQIINVSGVDCYEKDGTAYLRLENVARGLGFTDERGGVEYVRWARVDKYLRDLNFATSGERPEFIPENIFYRMAMKAKNEVAESFQAKVADEIIPSIRKHGAYIAGQETMTREQLIAKALVAANDIIDEKAKRITVLEQQIEQDKPFTDFGLAISTSEGSITIKQMAALLCQRGMRTGEKRLFEELRQDGFLLTTGGYYNEPAQRWMEQKLFEVRTSSYTNKYGNEQITRQTLITAKGIEYLMNYYLRKHGLMELLTVHRRQVTRQGGART